MNTRISTCNNKYYICVCFKVDEESCYRLDLVLLATLNWSRVLYPRRGGLVEKSNN